MAETIKPEVADGIKGSTEKLPDIQHLSVNENQDASSSINSARSGHSTPITEHTSEFPTNDSAALNQTPATGPIYTPFPHPLPSCKPETRPALTPDQVSKYDSVLSTVRGWTTLPTTSAKSAPTEPLSESEQMWLSRECILRYLRATSWNTVNALNRLQVTMIWRREYNVEHLTADYISPEMETGKECIQGYDVNARPCLFLDPGKQNTKKSERQVEGLVFMLERAIDMMEPGQETTALLINFKHATSGGSPSAGQGKQVLNILQGHYPERLGRACISDLPWYINTFFKLITPFIDPVTRSKMIFNTPLREKHVPASQLWKDYGGDADFEYDHEKYWPVLNKLCDERREAYRQRWVEAGKQIGEYEAYLRGGDQKPLKDVEAEQSSST